jgi:hypothetical protein
MISMVEKFLSANAAQEEVKVLAEAFDAGRFLEVVLVAPQVLEVLVEDLNVQHGFITDRFLSEFTEVDLHGAGVLARLRAKESIKYRIAVALSEVFEQSGETQEELDSFRKITGKLDSVFSLRNDLAHEFFKKKIRSSRIAAEAKNAFSLIETLLLHDLLK